MNTAAAHIADYETTPAGCWLPTRELNERQLSRLARRIFGLLRGPIPAGTVIARTCDEPTCVNPQHLVPTTRAEICQRGARAKLTADEVRAIRRLRAQGMPRAQVAGLFAVDPSAVSHICAGRRWAGIA